MFTATTITRQGLRAAATAAGLRCTVSAVVGGTGLGIAQPVVNYLETGMPRQADKALPGSGGVNRS